MFKLQHATRTRQYEIFKEYTRLVDDQSARLMTLRGLLRLPGVDDAAAESPGGPGATVRSMRPRASSSLRRAESMRSPMASSLSRSSLKRSGPASSSKAIIKPFQGRARTSIAAWKSGQSCGQ